jgi:hypothetical protein
MHKLAGPILIIALFSCAGCSKRARHTGPHAAIEPCSLISAQDIQEIQGAPLKDVNPSQQSNGRIRTSQCYFAADPSNRSVSLSITQSDPAASDADAAREHWKQTFARAGKGKNDEREEKEHARAKKEGGEEEEEGAPIEKIEGIGDEAYWSSSRVGGALYVLKDDLFLRISLGGPDDEKTKIEKSRKMAQRALDHL